MPTRSFAQRIWSTVCEALWVTGSCTFLIAIGSFLAPIVYSELEAIGYTVDNTLALTFAVCAGFCLAFAAAIGLLAARCAPPS